MTPIYIVDEIEAVVAKTATALAYPVYYMFGHWLEIDARLAELSRGTTTPDKKFPLIALITDIPIKVGGIIGMYGEASLRIIIANYTEKDYTSVERLALNFKPILYPIRDEFLHQVSIHRTFTFPGELQYTSTDRYYWGRNEKTVFNDRIDAIEITDLELNIENNSCLPAADVAAQS